MSHPTPPAFMHNFLPDMITEPFFFHQRSGHQNSLDAFFIERFSSFDPDCQTTERTDSSDIFLLKPPQHSFLNYPSFDIAPDDSTLLVSTTNADSPLFDSNFKEYDLNEDFLPLQDEAEVAVEAVDDPNYTNIPTPGTPGIVAPSTPTMSTSAMTPLPTTATTPMSQPVSSRKRAATSDCPEDILLMSTKEFNAYVKSVGLSRETLVDLRKSRRRMKNRGYSKTHRNKKRGEHATPDSDSDEDENDNIDDADETSIDSRSTSFRNHRHNPY
jgi:hypothetical protein